MDTSLDPMEQVFRDARERAIAPLEELLSRREQELANAERTRDDAQGIAEDLIQQFEQAFPDFRPRGAALRNVLLEFQGAEQDIRERIHRVNQGLQQLAPPPPPPPPPPPAPPTPPPTTFPPRVARYGRIRCGFPGCTETYFRSGSFLDHMLREHPAVFECRLCDAANPQRFSEVKLLKAHIHHVHGRRGHIDFDSFSILLDE